MKAKDYFETFLFLFSSDTCLRICRKHWSSFCESFVNWKSCANQIAVLLKHFHINFSPPIFLFVPKCVIYMGSFFVYRHPSDRIQITWASRTRLRRGWTSILVLWFVLSISFGRRCDQRWPFVWTASHPDECEPTIVRWIVRMLLSRAGSARENFQVSQSNVVHGFGWSLVNTHSWLILVELSKSR